MKIAASRGASNPARIGEASEAVDYFTTIALAPPDSGRIRVSRMREGRKFPLRWRSK
jgi:hypothetical protein